MRTFTGAALSWTLSEDVVVVELHRPPANEIGRATLAELERLAECLPELEESAGALVLRSSLDAGFGAGADLRELHAGLQGLDEASRRSGLRSFLQRIHAALEALDSTSLPTVAAVHGVVFGGGWELALTCDVVVADRTARFAFPELRLGILPAFGGVERLARDAGGALVRELLLTGRSLGAERAHTLGVVSHLAAEGRSLDVAMGCARAAARVDRTAAAAAKARWKPRVSGDRDAEIEAFCDLLLRPEAGAALREFVETERAMPWTPGGAP